MRGYCLPKKGYVSTGNGSLPQEFIDAIEKLLKDSKYIAEMKAKGYARISRALVIRMSLIEYLKGKGVDIG
jgi:hypothetical protein